MQAEKMVQMPMLIFRLVNVFVPFLQLAILSDFEGNELLECVPPLLGARTVFAENLRRGNGILECFASH